MKSQTPGTHNKFNQTRQEVTAAYTAQHLSQEKKLVVGKQIYFNYIIHPASSPYTVIL